jgi:hypothetical protein
MDDLTIEELKQLVLFYKQKASDLELNLLEGQLKVNRVISFKVSEDQKNKTVNDKKIKPDL